MALHVVLHVFCVLALITTQVTGEINLCWNTRGGWIIVACVFTHVILECPLVATAVGTERAFDWLVGLMRLDVNFQTMFSEC